MFAWLRRSAPAAPAMPLPAVPEGQRIYAIGDVHGRADLLNSLFDMIDADRATLPPAETTIVLLGDLIDRGPDSATVLAHVCERIDAGWPIRAIMGNHEEVLLDALAGDADALRRSLHIGGLATLASYGLTLDRLEQEVTEAEGLALVRAMIPERHRAFLAAMEPWIAIGDYLFVHAGIRPDVAIEAQAGEDLRWIRRPFLSHRDSFGPMVVHGHTIRTAPDLRSNRLGIDTGAYRTGRLTALVLDGTDRRILQTVPPPGSDEDAGGED